MHLLYVTDLHGDTNKYEKILEIAVEKNIKIIVIGGDMLPKQCDRHKEQPEFIKEFLRNLYYRCMDIYTKAQIQKRENG